MTDLGFQTLSLPAVDGIVARDNRASCRVLEKAGFALVGEAMSLLHGAARADVPEDSRTEHVVTADVTVCVTGRCDRRAPDLVWWCQSCEFRLRC
jgi:hypothetical protein